MPAGGHVSVRLTTDLSKVKTILTKEDPLPNYRLVLFWSTHVAISVISPVQSHHHEDSPMRKEVKLRLE